jgi:hypothetical protein
MFQVVLAFGFDPEIRGILVVLTAVAILMGSVYLVLGTNLGARLGLLVSLAALFGWMTIMSSIWLVYGIGLKGREPSWQPKDVIVGATFENATTPIVRSVPPKPDTDSKEGDPTLAGWKLLPEDDPGRGQAIAAADDTIVNKAKIFHAAGNDGPEYLPIGVYDKGGARFPKISDSIDFTAWFHKPHYVIVEVEPTVKTKTEPGKAPPTPVADTSQPARYVVLERNLGSRRQPSWFIMLGSSLIFTLLCLTLHRRDKYVTAHLRGADSKTPSLVDA